MSQSDEQDLSAFSMMDLFRQDAEAQVAVLNAALIALERNPTDKEQLEALMRAAHSLKGAARIVGLDVAVRVAHALEDCFVAAQKGEITIRPEQADILLRAVDLLAQIAQLQEADIYGWQTAHQADVETLVSRLLTIKTTGAPPPDTSRPAPNPPPPPTPAAAPTALAVLPSALPCEPAPATPPAHVEKPAGPSVPEAEGTDRTVRVSSENLNRLLGMTGEMLVQTHWFEPFINGMQHLKKQQGTLSRCVRQLNLLHEEGLDRQNLGTHLAEARRLAEECCTLTVDQIKSMDMFARQSLDLTERLYREAVTSRMRPFSDGVQGFPRMVRDLARQLHKQVRFEISGQTTGVDREILEKLEAPLSHLLRNALDHGIETPAEREQAGKNPEGCLQLEARHHAGLLHLTVSDDGRGVNLDVVRRKVINQGLGTEEMVNRMSETEVLDFLFLPGFTTSTRVTEISGRGVGMDIVRSLAQELGGAVHIENRPGQGACFHLQLPITLSVMRALLVEIAGEPCAIPLTRIEHLCTSASSEAKTLEGRPYLTLNGRNIGLVEAREVLEAPDSTPIKNHWPVVIVGNRSAAYGLIVDRFLGECKLVVRPLDPRLGKVPDLSAASLLDDGSPVIILDVEDLIRSIDLLLSGGKLKRIRESGPSVPTLRSKRVLVVDDSLTVREIERRLLENHGFEVEVAFDGMEAWNAVRSGRFDLVVSDVDMPRMNGFDLVRNIKQDARLNALPVVIVSYKDREEDRRRGLEAGASYYLTKSSFHDESFIHAVVDLIGHS